MPAARSRPPDTCRRFRVEQTKVATAGWDAHTLSLQAQNGQWAGGSYFSDLAEEPERQPGRKQPSVARYCRSVEWSRRTSEFASRLPWCVRRATGTTTNPITSRMSIRLCVIAWGTGNSPSRRRRSGSSRVPLLAADAAVGAACSATASLATVVHFRLLPHPFSAGEMVSAAGHCAGVIGAGCRVVHGENDLGERRDSACEVRISDLVASLSTLGNSDDESAAPQTGEVIGDIGSRQLESMG